MASFHSELMGKAREIQRLAEKKRAAELKLERELRNSAGGQPKPFGTEKAPAPPSYDWIPGLFEKFTEPDPESFDPIISAMRMARRKVDGIVMERMDLVERYVDEWKGDAAREFVTEFCNPMPKLVDHQCDLADILKAAVEANKEIFVRSRTDISAIADNTITALEAVGDCGGDEWAIALTVLGAVAGVAAAAVTGGTSLSITFAVVASGASVAAAGAQEAKSRELPMGGDTVDSILDNMTTAITELTKGIDHAERDVIRTLKNTYEFVTGSQKAEFIAPRPALADLKPSLVRTGDGVKPPY